MNPWPPRIRGESYALRKHMGIHTTSAMCGTKGRHRPFGARHVVDEPALRAASSDPESADDVGGGAESGPQASPSSPKDAVAAHVAPFVLWIVILFALGDPAGWKYAVRAAAGAAALLWFRPWRWYGPLRVGRLAWATLVGVAVFVVWVLPETPWMARWGGLQEAYLRWAVVPFGKIPEAPEIAAYAPETCGWVFTVTRLMGAALIIPIIEEFFWRGFLYRWLIGTRFTDVDLGALRVPVLLAVSVVFGLEHQRWLVGIFAGLAYGLFVIKTRDIWAACVAHGITNLLLGWYVLATRAYAFW